MNYQLIDSGLGQKLERFGEVVLIRPAASAVWRPRAPVHVWDQAHARFDRLGGNQWSQLRPLPDSWEIRIEGIQLLLKRTDFGHLGFFPEHATLWTWITEKLSCREGRTHPPRFLNLFAYSGGASLVAARAGAEVVHLDAAKGMVNWAKQNAERNGIHSIRWITEDVRTFLTRAVRRQEKYEAILLDPPSFGRGKSQEVFKIERDLSFLLHLCHQLLSDNPLFVLLTCHTPGFTPLVLQQLLREALSRGRYESGEMVIPGECPLPAGSYARWEPA